MTTAYEKLRVDYMKESREMIRLKNKLALVGDRETSGVGDSLDIYLPITPRVIGSDDRSGGGGGDREGILRRRIALLESDLAAANSARRARIPSRSGTPPTPRGGSGSVGGGRDSDREREKERSRVKKMARERLDSGYGSGGGYGSSRSTAANGYGRPGSSSFSQLAPATLAKARDRERERERSLSRGRGGSSGYMRYSAVQYYHITCLPRHPPRLSRIDMHPAG